MAKKRTSAGTPKLLKDATPSEMAAIAYKLVRPFTETLIPCDLIAAVGMRFALSRDEALQTPFSDIKSLVSTAVNRERWGALLEHYGYRIDAPQKLINGRDDTLTQEKIEAIRGIWKETGLRQIPDRATVRKAMKAKSIKIGNTTLTKIFEHLRKDSQK